MMVNDKVEDNNMETAPTQDVNKCDTDDMITTGQTKDKPEILDSGHDRNSRHRKKKRHRHRSRSSNAESMLESGIGNEGENDGDNETGEDSSGNNENVVVSSSTRRRRSKGSSRHHKRPSKDFVSGEDSGLSLGNSLNDSMVVRDISRVTDSKESEVANRAEITAEMKSQKDVRTHDIKNDLNDENKNDSTKQDAITKKSKDGSGAILPNTSVSDQSTMDTNALTTKEDLIVHHQHVLTEQKNVNESKKTDRIHRRLERQKTQYRLQKEMLKQRLDETKVKFQEEITKYENDLSDHRREYLKELGSLQLQEQYESLSLRIEDVGQLEEELDKRFKDCIEQQTDIEEMERFLNMREELCKTKERDIKKLDDELDAWQDELDIKRRQLETADTSRRRTGASLNTSYSSKPTTDEDDYILKKNLLKCQADLARSEEENTALHKQLDALKKQFDAAHIQTHNHEKKIKQLESQLVIALSQLGSQKPNNLNQNSLPPINGHRPSIASSSAESRVDEIQREMRSRRHMGKDHLSINQEAALRRKLSGKDSGVSTRTPSSTRISTRTPSTSRKDISLNEGAGGRSNASGSAGGSQSGEEGCQRQGTDDTDVGKSPAKSSTFHSSKTEKSSVCVVM